MKKSRQQSQKPVSLVKVGKKERSLSLNLDKIRMSTFIKKFEGKINIVTKQGGLRGILMKTIVPVNNRYQQKQNRNVSSRIKTQMGSVDQISKSLTPNLVSNSTNNKQNINRVNIQKRSKLATANTICLSEQQKDKQITPFHLPQLNRIKLKKQVKRWQNVPKNNSNVYSKERKSVQLVRQVRKLR